jgi:repressor LexA
MKADLTNNEEMVLNYIEDYLRSHKMYPTYREIQSHLALRSINSISQYIKQLEYKGILEVKKNKGYRLFPSQKDQIELIHLRVLGNVQAGLPKDAGSDNEIIKLPNNFVKNPDITFALRVRGNSMADAGIHEGDIVIVEKRPKAFNGEVIVALVNNENTVKRYIRHEDGTRYLKAESQFYSDIIPDGDWVLQGVVIGLWREY